MDYKNSISKNVKKFRIELGLSRAEVAGRAGLHVTYVARVENRPFNITIDSLCQLAKALRRHPGELLGYESVIVDSLETISKLDQVMDLIRDIREKVVVSPE
jgi:transcriptional regulator with XRE-family HTH domain